MSAISSAGPLASGSTRRKIPRPHCRPHGHVWSLAALATAAVMAMTACGQKPSEQAATSTKPIVVGISLPLTGDFSQPGGEAKRGYEVWQKMVNAKGGVLGRQIELKIADDASNQDTVVADYTKLITQDKVDLLLGTFSSLLNYPASAVAEKNGKVYVEPAGGAPMMFERGFKYLFFAQPATAPHQADVFVDWVRTLPASERPKTAAYPSQDDPFTAPVIESMQRQLEGLGVKTVYSSVYPADTTNFQTIASQMANQRPDLIAQGAVFEDGVGLVRLPQAAELLAQDAVPDLGAEQRLAIQRRGGCSEHGGVFYTVSWNEKATTPLNAEFVAAYKEAYGGSSPAEDAADAFAAAQVLQAATTAVGSLDQTKIRDWLHANAPETILGPLSWTAKGEPKGKFLLAQWQSGKVEVVGPPDVATTMSIVNPKPGWK